MQMKRATLIIFSIRQDEYLFLSKSVKVLKFKLTFLILRNKQSKKNCNNLPQGRGNLLHLI